MSAYTDALARKPHGLDARHEAVARTLLGREEGITRTHVRRLLDMDERAFRERCEEISAAGWLPIIVEHKDGPTSPGWYRIARAHESELVSDEAERHYARAVSLHKRSRGLLKAFQAHHSAGTLFLASVPDELGAA